MDGKRSYLIDMDGVLVRGRDVIPGAPEFIERLRSKDIKFLVLTNNPIYTPGDLSHRLRIAGIEIPPQNIYTSAMATARFMANQRRGNTAFVIGESGLTSPVHEAGFIITDHEPDYVVLGEPQTYNFDVITKAIRLISAGAIFLATNPDPAGPGEGGVVPACGAMAALIQSATGKAPFFVGKPNPLMMRNALNHLGVHSEETTMIGDRMDTDIVAGVQSGLDTILVMTGVTRPEDLDRYPYHPGQVVDSVADIEV